VDETGVDDAIENHLDGIMNLAPRQAMLFGQENDHVFFRHLGLY
jgi:hypothetical protein